MTQDFVPRMTLIIGTRRIDPDTIAQVRSRIDAVPGGKAPANVTTLEQHLSRIAMAPERIAVVLVGASASVALVLGVLGLYGAMTDAAHQRRREFGVRIALGSQGWRLVRQVLGEGARLAAGGLVAGLLLSRIVDRWLTQINPSASTPAVWVWLAAPLALLGAVLIASVLPARLALATSPLSVMRNEQ
jgi:ABC-type antimicrobial peptide transport system permease subunit